MLSEAGLAFIATRLGFEWTLLALQLGVRQEKVEQVQMSMRNAYQQILEVLKFWRDLPAASDHPPSHRPGSDGEGDAGGDGRGVDKIRQLLRVLRQDGIDKHDLVQEISDKFHITLDDE